MCLCVSIETNRPVRFGNTFLIRSIVYKRNIGVRSFFEPTAGLKMIGTRSQQKKLVSDAAPCESGDGLPADGSAASGLLEAAVPQASEVQPSVDSSLMSTQVLETMNAMSRALSQQAAEHTILARQVAGISRSLDNAKSLERPLAPGIPVGEAHTPFQSAGDSKPDMGQTPAVAGSESVAGRRFARPQEYDGTVPWESFRAQFEAVAAIHGWNAQDCLGELVACLRGPALEMFSHLAVVDRRDYSHLMTALEQRFGSGHQETWFRAQFRRRLRTAGEPLPALARDIEKLAYQAYPSASQELRNSLSCDRFLEALGDADLQIAVHQSRPSNLQDALASAIEFEAIRRSVRTTNMDKHSASGFSSRQGRTESVSGGTSMDSRDQTLHDILERIKALEASLSSTPVQMQGSPFAHAQGRQTWRASGCWGCGQLGHIRKFCPQRQGSNSAAGARQGPGNGQ